MRRGSAEPHCPACALTHHTFLHELTSDQKRMVPRFIWDEYPLERWTVLRCRYCDSVSLFPTGDPRQSQARKIGALTPSGEWE
jgi:hypothetical protein